MDADFNLAQEEVSKNYFQEKIMVSAEVTNVLSQCFVLKANGNEYQITEDNEAFNVLVGCKKGDVVQVKIEGGKIIKVER